MSKKIMSFLGISDLSYVRGRKRSLQQLIRKIIPWNFNELPDTKSLHTYKKTFSEELYYYECRIIADRFIYLRPYCDSLEYV